MLVISRQVDEHLYFDLSQATDADIARLRAGVPLVVMVVDIRGDKVRLGLTAPKSVDITRPDAPHGYVDKIRGRQKGETKEGGPRVDAA